MVSSITYAKFIFTTCTMFLTGSLLAFVNQAPKESLLHTAPLKSVHWTELLSSVYNADRFEKISGTVNESSKNFESMVSLHSAAKHRVTFLPQIHFIESFGPVVDKLAAEFAQEKDSDFGSFIHKKILAAGPLEVNLLARILEVYNSQLAIYDHLSTSIKSLGNGETITIFLESLQYTHLAKIGLPAVDTMGPFLIKNGAAELAKALYPNKVKLIGTELMDLVALDDAKDSQVVDSFIDSDENLSELYLRCIKKFKAEKIRFESKCYRLLILRQREANAVAVIKHHLQENEFSKSFLIYGAAHPMPIYSDEILKFDYPVADTLQAINPLLKRQLKALGVLNKLLFEQSLVIRDFKNTQKFTQSLADELLKNLSKGDDLSSNSNFSSTYYSNNS